MSQLLAAVTGILNACEPTPGLVTGGQPSVEHLAALKGAGCDVVLDTRDPMEEQPFDPAVVVRAAGLRYINIVVSHSAPEANTLDQVRGVLAGIFAAGERAFVYCNSGNRVGAVLIPYFVLDLGWSEDDAVARAMQIGTRSAELIEGALAYIRGSGASTSASR